MEKRLMVTQVASTIARPKIQLATLKGLGLGKIGRSKTLNDTPEIRGMIAKVSHLIVVEEVG